MRNPKPTAPAPSNGRYVFDPDKLHEIAQLGVGKPHQQMVDAVVEGMQNEYAEWVQPQDWIYNCAGGAVGVMKLLHASLSEYVLIFGTPIGTEGFSGRYRVGIWDFVMSGDMWTYTDDNIGEKVITRPGERAYLSPDRVKGYRLPDGGWMLEYGRGPIPTVLPFGLADATFSMMDGTMLRQTIFTYGKLTVRNLLKGKI
jgi:C-8 sterol isomerase